MNRIAVLSMALCLSLAMASELRGFSPGPDEELVEAGRQRAAKKREQLGDRRFAMYAIGRLKFITRSLPRQHPLFEQRRLQKGTPEHWWSVNEHYATALIHQLEQARAHKEETVAVLENVLGLYRAQVEKTGFMSYGDHPFFQQAHSAYLTLGIKGPDPVVTDELAFLRRYLLKDRKVAGGIDVFRLAAKEGDPGFGEDNLIEFLRNYAAEAIYGPGARGTGVARVIGKRRGMGASAGAFLDLAENGRAPARLMALMVLAHYKGLDKPLMQKPFKQWRRLLRKEWRGYLDTWQAEPFREHNMQNVRLAWLKEAVRAQPAPVFKALALETARLLPSFYTRRMLEPYDLAEDQLAWLHDRLEDPTLLVQQRVRLMKMLMELDYRPVAEDVTAFIERYRLVGRGHDSQKPRVAYPALGIDSLQVHFWQQWVKQGAKTQPASTQTKDKR